MVERKCREVVDRVPICVAGELRIDVAGHETEVRGRELPFLRRPFRIAQRLELLEVRELTHVDLLGEVTSDRLLERVAHGEVPTRK